jgi:hypothetical protein
MHYEELFYHVHASWSSYAMCAMFLYPLMYKLPVPKQVIFQPMDEAS